MITIPKFGDIGKNGRTVVSVDPDFLRVRVNTKPDPSCNTCEGSGSKPFATVDEVRSVPCDCSHYPLHPACTTCKGTGRLKTKKYSPAFGGIDIPDPCPACKGEGYESENT